MQFLINNLSLIKDAGTIDTRVSYGIVHTMVQLKFLSRGRPNAAAGTVLRETNFKRGTFGNFDLKYE